MKTKLFFLACLSLFGATNMMAQNRTTVNALSSEISDNLDLKAVASVFGESSDLSDFEQRLNDPTLQLSNLDLNSDNQVDYLRVIESIEGNAHIIVIQSVIGRDLFQDVATVEVQKLANNRVQVQVVGDVYMYGNNYIYEPVYVATPVIYASFWSPRYHPYVSSFYWGYYPSYYSFWNPYPIFRYRNNINIHINSYNTYTYVNNRNCLVAYTNYYGRRANGYERQYPNRSFSKRNSGFTNRYDFDTSRSKNNVAYTGNQRSNTRNNNSTTSSRANSNATATRNYNTTNSRSENASNSPRNATRSTNTSYNRSRSVNSNNSVSPPRNQTSTRNYASPKKSNSNSGSVRTTQRTAQNSQSSGSTRNYSQNNSNKNTASSGNSRAGNSRENNGSRR